MSTSLTKISNNQYRYNRSSSFEYDQLCKILSEQHGLKNKCIVTMSGIAAIHLAFQTIFIQEKWKPINIIYR